MPVHKPLLIVVLNGVKQLGPQQAHQCAPGQFVLLSNSPNTEMRNIPDNSDYSALLVEFDQEDFTALAPTSSAKPITFCQGHVDAGLRLCLQQYLIWSTRSDPVLWPHRRQEILLYLQHHKLADIAALASKHNVSQQLFQLIRENVSTELSIPQLCQHMAMSESTLRRKLQKEGNSIQSIKDDAKLGHGMHLVQTSQLAIGLVAEQCGYQSQSRFTDRFKQRFGVTPTQLRKTLG